MNTILFFFKRVFVFFADLVILPTMWLVAQWRKPGRGRASLLSLPAVFMGGVLSLSGLFALLSNNARLERDYYERATKAQNEAQRLLELKPGDNYLDLANRQLNIAEAYWKKLRQFDEDNNDYLHGIFLCNFVKATQIPSEDTASYQMTARGMLLNQLAPSDRAVHAKSHLLRADLMIQSYQASNSENELNAAQRQVEFAYRLDRNDDEVNLKMAQLHLLRREYAKALEIYERYYRKYPVFTFQIAEILKALNRESELAKYLDVSAQTYVDRIEKFPDNAALWERYLRILSLRQEFEKGESLLLEKIESITDESLKREFDDVLGQFYAFWAGDTWQKGANIGFTDKGFIDLYFELLRKGYVADNKNQRVLQMLTASGQGDSEYAKMAREIYDPVVDPQNASVETLVARGTYELSHGDFTLGIELLEIALKKDQSNPILLNNLAFGIRREQPDRALELIDKGLQRAPMSPNLYDTRGHILVELKQYEKAVSSFLMAEQRGKVNDVNVNRALAFCYRELKLDELAEAREANIEKLLQDQEAGSGN
ncbi:MAG TPA: hypothetical protein PKD64_09645 [Pirellulaceae bacterium]|nr:hypothetical protein [Pirellulaceae bacterium]HMO92449.1 hypothetical protein [Pirellulaceae bacterium]HMP67881.1 hypothetical protein [Pirellulaceae bacterium]